MGQASGVGAADALDLVITNALIIEAQIGIVKADIGIKGNRIVTRPRSHDILHGITRAAVLRFAAEAQMEVEERLFTIDEAKAADEAFITSASAFVMPVVRIDDAELGGGKPGPKALRLREIYLEESLKAAV